MSLSPAQIAALVEVSQIWPGLQIVIIGATALGFHVEMRWRQTADLDLVIAVGVDDLQAIAQRPGWHQSALRQHEFRSPHGARMDILPAAAPLIERGHIAWPSGHMMSLAGMDLVFAHAVARDLGGGHLVHVAPAPVVAVLKMVAYGDRPSERERDLADIAYLLDVYVEDDSDRRWDEAADVEYDLAPAFLLGRDIGRLARETHRPLIGGFLDRVGDPDSVQHAIMQRLGPSSWRGEEGALQRRLDVFHRGFEGALVDRAAEKETLEEGPQLTRTREVAAPPSTRKSRDRNRSRLSVGGADGTRTRGLRRDRPAL